MKAPPGFKYEDLIKKHNVAVFSSNYTLYSDMSERVMSTLAQSTPEIEIYSIDEAFLNLTAFSTFKLTEYAKNIRSTVKKHTATPISMVKLPVRHSLWIADLYLNYW